MPVRLRPRARTAASQLPCSWWIQIALPDERGLCHAFERLSAREQVHNLFLRISPHIYLFLTDNITDNILVSARVQRDRNPT